MCFVKTQLSGCHPVEQRWTLIKPLSLLLVKRRKETLYCVAQRETIVLCLCIKCIVIRFVCM